MSQNDRQLNKKELLRQVERFIMDTGELINLIEKSAQEYHLDALNGILRNIRYYKLTKKEVKLLKKNPKIVKNFIVVLLADFINHIALKRGLNRGELPENIRANP